MTPGPILLVEDDADLRTIYRTSLEVEGFSVIEAVDGSEAMHVLLSPDGARIRLLVSDVVMPKLGGRELLWRAAEFFPQLPVVLLSGRVDEEVAYIGLDARPTAFLRKPFDPRKLREAVRELLDPPEAEHAHGVRQ